MIDLSQTIDALLARITNHRAPVIDLKLERMHAALQAMGNPHRAIPPVIHVAGTNGKGSVLAYLTAIYAASGKAVHRYTSPHLVRFHERIMLAGALIDDATLEDGLQRILDVQTTHPLTYFESATAMAFMCFAEHEADVTLLEVGLGGRLDATHVIDKPVATVITPIGMDHQAYLGDSLALIAAEKAAIMKPDVPAIISPQHQEAQDVIMARARQIDAQCWRYGVEWQYDVLPDGRLHYASPTLDVTTPPPSLLGKHQYDNAATAIATIDMLHHADSDIKQSLSSGIQQAVWPGRLQRLPIEHTRPLTVHPIQLYLDGAHNISAAYALRDWMAQHDQPIHIICAMRADKDVAVVMQALCEHAASVAVTTIQQDDGALSADALAEYARPYHAEMERYGTLADALRARGMTISQSSCILVTGSLYLAGEMLGMIEAHE